MNPLRKNTSRPHQPLSLSRHLDSKMAQDQIPLTERVVPELFSDSEKTLVSVSIPSFDQRSEKQNLWPECRQTLQGRCRSQTGRFTKGLSQPIKMADLEEVLSPRHHAYG